jgi:LemA protein
VQTLIYVILACIVISMLAFLVIVYMIWASNNRLIALEERCDNAFADIDTMLKQRHDLIPGLVDTVRNIAGHESAMLDKIIAARAAAVRPAAPEARQAAEAELGQTVSSALTIVEAYPELAASSHVRDLREQFTALENRITAARRFHNLTVSEYNATLRQFPTSMIGYRKQLARKPLFDLGSERARHEDAASLTL